jgi:hypothetical protein
MPTICLHKSPLNGINTDPTISNNANNNTSTTKPINPLPSFLQTPSGLAIIEIQGTINLPASATDLSTEDSAPEKPTETPIGRLVFPDYSPNDDPADTKWMKRVYLYIGHHQRMTGEVKKLDKPLGVIQKRRGSSSGEGEEELEIVEVIRHRAIFSSRPEPVGSLEARYG